VRAGGGLIVTEVSPDGPAYQRLVDVNTGGPDIILKVNGTTTRTREEFRTAMAQVKKGEIVTLSILRRSPDGWVGDVVRIRIP